MDMIERVAKAMYEAMGPEAVWDKLDDNLRNSFRTRARAAIAAMREPTGAMVDAGHVVIHEQGPPWLCEADRTKPYHVISMPEDVAQRWRQMIGAALQDKSP